MIGLGTLINVVAILIGSAIGVALGHRLPQRTRDVVTERGLERREHAERVQALPTEGVEPTSHPLPMVNGFRPDEITPCLDRESFLDAAPDSCDGQFRVPRILGE